MLDTIKLERKGIPTVALIHDRFEEAAHNQAKMLKLASAKLISIPEPSPGEPVAELAARIDRAWDDIIGALVKS